VNIQDSSEFSCQQLNRDLWASKDVKDTVRENFVFLQYAHDSEAGLDYITLYPFPAFPHISILDPRTGEQLKVWSEVPATAKWLEDAHEFLERYSLDPSHRNPVAKIRRNKTNPDHMTEEEQIEMAVRQSLGVPDQGDVSNSEDDYVSVGDGASDIVVLDAPCANQGTSHTVPAPTTSSEMQLTHEDIFASILPINGEEPATDPKTTTRIQFRLGDGSRVIRRFNLLDTVRSLFAFAKGAIPAVQGHYFSLTSERRNLIDMLDDTISGANLQNSVVLVEILDE
jgi:hypothetical protein